MLRVGCCKTIFCHELLPWQKIVLQHPTLSKIQNLNAEDITQLDGFAEKTAESIVHGLESNKELIKEILGLGVKPQEIKTDPNASSVLKGCTFVLTGKLSKPREEIAEELILLGAKVSSSTSSKTTAVVCEDVDGKSSKLQKARKLGVSIWTEKDLNDFVKTKS